MAGELQTEGREDVEEEARAVALTVPTAPAIGLALERERRFEHGLAGQLPAGREGVGGLGDAPKAVTGRDDDLLFGERELGPGGERLPLELGGAEELRLARAEDGVALARRHRR